MTEARPFLKWAGGKRQLAPQLLALFPRRFETYYEPFIGGGAVFFALANSPYHQFAKATLNDFNEELINVWRVVRDFPSELMEHLKKLPIDKDFFLQLRAKMPAEFDPVQRAGRTIYLNKLGFNGLYRVNKKGVFNVPWGKFQNPSLFIRENIEACSKALAHVRFTSGDFAAAVEDAGVGSLVYFDPPYIELSKTSNFTSYTSVGFSIEDQYRLAACFSELVEKGAAVVASNSDTPLVRDLYQGWEMHEVQVRRAINSKADKRGPVGELIIVGRRESILPIVRQ